jgi:hypothetical protein
MCNAYPTGFLTGGWASMCNAYPTGFLTGGWTTMCNAYPTGFLTGGWTTMCNAYPTGFITEVSQKCQGNVQPQASGTQNQTMYYLQRARRRKECKLYYTQ